VTTPRLINQSEAVDWARSFAFGHCRLEPFVPKVPVADHDAAEHFFFRVTALGFEVSRGLIIAVRRTDGRISQCGVIGEWTARPLAAG
jgi:hypothetical protein